MKYVGIDKLTQNEIWSPVWIISIERRWGGYSSSAMITFKRPDGHEFTYSERAFRNLYKPFIEPNKIWKELNEA